MSDATVRTARSSGFTVVQNNAVRDPRLSLSAVGLYVRMMSLPEGRAHSVRYIAKVAGCGRDALRRCFSELEAAGYLVREQQHVEHGKFGANAYLLYDSPISPSTGNPSTVNPATAEPATAEPSPENPSTKEINTGKKYTPISPSGGEADAQKKTDVDLAAMFDRFWALYPRKTNKQAARRAWMKLRPDLLLCMDMSQALKAQIRSESWQRDGGRYIPHPSTWINGRRWEDEMPAATAARGAPQTPERMEDQWLT